MTLKELRIRRIRNEIRARELAESLDVSTGWIYQLERYYRGPSIPMWQVRYEEALKEIIDARNEQRRLGLEK